MVKFTRSDDLRGAEFFRTDLREARFVAADLDGVVMRGVSIAGAEIESPWLFEEGALYVNGVDVVPLMEAELNRRFPGRGDRHAGDPEGLRAAWAAVERAWAPVLERVAAMPAGAVDASVGGEWSFAQTLRHLVMATDTWLRRAVLEVDKPYHPLGQPDSGSARSGLDVSVFATGTPPYDEVLNVRAERVAMVRDFLATVTPEVLASTRPDAWNPENRMPVLACLHTILDEEWEHLRYAVRDLDALQRGE
jgi:hypothetical protein